MKIESYILRFGDAPHLREIAQAALVAHGCYNPDEVEAFIIRAVFAQQLIQAGAASGTTIMSLKIIDGRLYIAGESDGLAFTI